MDFNKLIEALNKEMILNDKLIHKLRSYAIKNSDSESWDNSVILMGVNSAYQDCGDRLLKSQLPQSQFVKFLKSEYKKLVKVKDCHKRNCLLGDLPSWCLGRGVYGKIVGFINVCNMLKIKIPNKGD